MVFQSPCLLPWLTAFENVMLGVDQVFSTATKEGLKRQIAEDYQRWDIGEATGIEMQGSSQGLQVLIAGVRRPQTWPLSTVRDA